MDNWCKAFVMLITPAVAFAHEGGTTWERLGITDPITVLLYSSLISGFFVAGALYYRESIGKNAKKIMFVMISAPIIIATFYLAASTIYLNINSESGGPVHWHADYEVWACGVKYELIDPTGIDNKVGTPLLHEHNDNRIHVEGTLLELHDATLGEFFEVTGGELTGDSLSMTTNNGVVRWTNGELCSGQPARWYVFVNGNLTENPADYVFAPYTDVPPGDIIKIIFSEKSPENMNTELFEVP